MFTIHLRKGAYSTGATLCVKAPTLDKALAFVRTFSLDGMIIESNWTERAGRYDVDIYDWLECWSANPPLLARVTAPIGFVPTDDHSRVTENLK